MFKTLSGKLAAVMLLIFIIEFIAFIVAVFTNNGFGAMVSFIQYAPVTAILGLIFGVLGIKREAGIGKAISIITLMISLVFVSFSLFFIFGYSFGG
jgi:hypothetical protein